LLDRLLDPLAPHELLLVELLLDNDEDSDSLTDENDLLEPRLSEISSSNQPLMTAKVALRNVLASKVFSIALSPLRLCSGISASDEPLIGLELRSGAVREPFSLESLADAGKANDDAHDGVFRIGLHSHADCIATDDTQAHQNGIVGQSTGFEAVWLADLHVSRIDRDERFGFFDLHNGNIAKTDFWRLRDV